MNPVHVSERNNSIQSRSGGTPPARVAHMDYVKPTDVLDNMLNAGATKAALAPRDLIIRGMLSGGLLGIPTSLALTATLQTNLPIIGALIFPVGLVLVVLLGLDLVPGSFALVPL